MPTTSICRQSCKMARFKFFFESHYFWLVPSSNSPKKPKQHSRTRRSVASPHFSTLVPFCIILPSSCPPYTATREQYQTYTSIFQQTIEDMQDHCYSHAIHCWSHFCRSTQTTQKKNIKLQYSRNIFGGRMRPVSHGVCVSVHLGRKYNFTKGSLISSLMGLKRPKGSDGDCVLDAAQRT